MRRPFLPSAPEPLRCDVGALAHGFEFFPHHGGMHFSLVERLRRKAAIGAGHHILATDQLCEAHESLSDQLGMLDDIARMRNDARTKHLAIRNLDLLEQMIFMLMPRIGTLEAILPGID